MKQQLNGIGCYDNTRIYIFCPAGFATGGPEALHQLGAQLIKQGFCAFMYYYNTPDSVDVVHKNYEKYAVPHVSKLENSSKHIMVLPETHLGPLFSLHFNNIRKIIWWLSVVNYYITQKHTTDKYRSKRFFKLQSFFGRFPIASLARLKREKNVMHICHSYYSQVHLQANGIKSMGRISDYMNSAFFNMVDEDVKKENLILYNPKKNDEFLDSIISQTSTLNWLAIKDMTPAEVAYKMNKAKLYVDFGYHPGKERMPREACIMRCCMIIGRNGSAAFKQDMPIPEEYRFEKKDEDIPEILNQINNCLENYDTVKDDFGPYRSALYREEEEFIADIKKVFIKI